MLHVRGVTLLLRSLVFKTKKFKTKCNQKLLRIDTRHPLPVKWGSKLFHLGHLSIVKTEGQCNEKWLNWKFNQNITQGTMRIFEIDMIGCASRSESSHHSYLVGIPWDDPRAKHMTHLRITVTSFWGPLHVHQPLFSFRTSLHKFLDCFWFWVVIV